MYQLDNPIMNYPWGSPSAIAQLQGRRASGEPEAELWMGAHPKAPSMVQLGQAPQSLQTWLSEDPQARLGARVAADFSQLPFLFKVLAAAKPLSLQAHPNLEQARAGFDAEEQAGVPLLAPNRNYRDSNHKPELICALTPFEALCGFRPLNKALDLVRTLDCAELDWLRQSLSNPRQTADGQSLALRDAFSKLLTASVDDQQRWLAATRRALEVNTVSSEFQASFDWCLELMVAYPGDIGAVVSLLLNHTTLQPGEALFLPAGNLHAYLRGTGLELMANSDNVLRGGLTPKHVDVPELMKVLRFVGLEVNKCSRVPKADGQWAYPTAAPEFELWQLELTAQTTRPLPSDGPEILLVTQGTARVETAERTLTLRQGESVFVPPIDYTVTGPGTVYRAIVPAQSPAMR